MSSGPDSDRARRIAELGFDPSTEPAEAASACNLCDSTLLVEAAKRDRYDFPVRFVVCGGCGLGFLSPRLTADAYGAFYDGVYRPLVSAYHGRRIDAETIQVEQRDYAADLVDYVEKVLPRAPRTILDIGGSTGVVAGAFAQRLRTQVTVLDPAPDELAVAEAAGMETVPGFIEDYDPGERRFDLVLLCQTIDHLLDIRSALDAMRRVVAADGYMFVDLLDVGFMLERRGAIEGAVKIDHPYYLTRATGRAFLTQSGFAVVSERMSGDGHWGFLARPDRPAEPDWVELARAADALVERIWRLRAIA